MARTKLGSRRSGCPIALALDVVGDAWSLLVVRDLMFKGRTTYQELLDGGERIATNVLADRLRLLESAGLVERRRSTVDARRVHYRLTEKGIDLAPTLVELILWSARHGETDAPPDTLAAMREDRAAFVAQLRNAWERARQQEEGS